MSDRLTFSLASLIVLIAFGLVFVTTPAMAVTLADKPSIPSQIEWVQGKPKINITFPKATASRDDGVLTTSLTVNGVGVTTSNEVITDTAANGPLQGLTYKTTIVAATGTPVVRATATGSLEGNNAHHNTENLAVIVYTVNEDENDPDALKASVTFNVRIIAAPELTFGSQTIDNLSLNTVDLVNVVFPEATGGIRELTYTLEDTNNTTINIAGLTFNASTRRLFGIPAVTSDLARAVYVYKVTDSGESGGTEPNIQHTAELRFTIEIDSTPPSFDPKFSEDKVPDRMYTKDHAVSKPAASVPLPKAVEGTGTGELSYSLDKTPAGVDFDPVTRLLSGTPTKAGVVNAVYTVKDEAEVTATLAFKITVNPEVSFPEDDDKVANFPSGTDKYLRGDEFAPLSVPRGADEGTGDKTKYTYAVSGLPDGLMFDDSDTKKLKITGTPTMKGISTVTVTATDEVGASGSYDFMITVTEPPNLTFKSVVAPQTYTVGTPITPMLLPLGDGGIGPYTYALEGLPADAGITFAPTTRLLSGTPEELAVGNHSLSYVISDSAFSHIESPTADQVPNTVTLPISITVVGTGPPVTNMPPSFAADAKVDNLVATAGVAISGRFLPEATDPEGDTVRYWISPALPAGLTFDTTTRALTGTPSVMMAQTVYTYNAADAGSIATPRQLPFFITVNNAAPVYADSTPVAITGNVGAPIAPVDVSATDTTGDTLTYSWGVDEAALGLMLNASTGMITGTPLKVHTGLHPVTATDSGGLTAMRNVSVNIAAAPPANVAPDVMITTSAPTAAQMDSFAIAYTVTDANGDTPIVSVSKSISPASATTVYTVDDSVAGMVTITQAAGAPIAVIDVTITATDPRDSSLSDSESISVTFAAKGTPAVDTTPPTVTITVAPAANMTVAGTTYTDVLGITLDFNEPIDAASLSGKIGRVGGDTYLLTQIGTAMVDPVDNTVYRVYVNSPGYETRAQTRVLLKLGVMDLAGNAIPVDNIGIYTPPAVPAPTVTIAANPHPINCETGSTITFTLTHTSEALVAGDITISAGWKIGTDNNPADGTISIVPKGDGSEIGVTTVEVKVAKDAVMNTGVPAKGNAEKTETFTVGPVLEIPAGGYITVIRPEHQATNGGMTHLEDPLYVGHTGVRAPRIIPKSWECMPDLTIFFGRTVPAIGGGAIVVKQADGPLGHVGSIAKGSVGISEIMWASDEGVTHGGIPAGGRSNLDQTRDQWIELHNRSNTMVKVTLFARPTNTALTIEPDEIDRVSNYNIDNVWVVPGQSGNSAHGIDFISMQRGTPNKPEGYAHGDFNGSSSDKWSKSTIPYLTRRAALSHTGQLAAENLTYDFLGTPGRSNSPSPTSPTTRKTVPKDTIVFNEVANRRDQTLEWIELKNVSDAEVNLKKYQISLATAKGTDVAFYTFPDNDNIKLAAGEVLLLLDTSPRDNDGHPIAVGHDRDTGNDQALGLGQNQTLKAHLVRYKIANFREGGLPDDGNFVLYLRNRNDRLKSHEGVIDVIGWSDKLADAALHTKYWPLQVFDGRRWEKGGLDERNKIAVETVHYRQHRIDPDANTHKDDKDEHQALRDAGYTGIGYKRHAHRIAAHGGTPGYEDIRKNLVADIAATGVLTISEIMYDQGDGSYPQWIEIYNSSPTQAVNLHSEAGWRLVIENYDDPDLVGNERLPIETLSGTLNFKNSDVQTILPQQTVLVTSTRARSSGSAFFDTRVVFPATRVFSAWDDQRGELTLAADKGGRPTDPILSDRGFYIELIDGKGNLSDGVGNLVKSPNRRVASTIEWELSDVVYGKKAQAADGRSSILRRYNSDWKRNAPGKKYSQSEVLRMGIQADGWIAASETDFLKVRETWYGHQSDYGSPGITSGRVLPVSLSKFRPERLKDSGEIVVRWITESELNNAGFNILRSEKRDSGFTKVHFVAGQGTTSERTVYEWTDKSAKPNVVYYYQIQDVSLDGEVTTLRTTHLRGNVTAAGKATTTWGKIKALQ